MPQTKQSLVVSETMLKLLFDRFENSNCRSTEAVVELNKTILLLLKTVGNNPREVLKVVDKLNETISKIDKELDNTAAKSNTIESMCSTVVDLMAKIDRRMWKFYVAIGVSFTLGMVLLAMLLNLQTLLKTLIQGS